MYRSKQTRSHLFSLWSPMRKSIDGLSAIVQEEFQLDPFSSSLFLLGRKNDRIKALYWDGDGFLLMYKHLEREEKRKKKKIFKIQNLDVVEGGEIKSERSKKK